jgi:hypothetical protein
MYLTNDIGLIKLATPLTFDGKYNTPERHCQHFSIVAGNTRAIPLAEQELQSDTVVTVSGWGQTSDGRLTRRFPNWFHMVQF